jgi:type 1 glutamine amidotransferase
VVADDAWIDGPELLDGSDGAVLFRSEGAKWCSADEKRLAAFRRLAERRGGLSVLHWGMGTRTAEPVADFTPLFGACHGGPDRKYRVLETKLTPVAVEHPVTRGIMPLTIRDEFYYALKLPPSAKAPQSLLEVEIDDQPYMVAWAWDRPDGGRSFGFSGLHFHEHWQRPEYRMLVKQGVLWTLKLP